MKLAALLLIAACERAEPAVATGSGSPEPAPPGPGHLDVSVPKTAHGDEVVSMMRVSVTATDVYVNGDRKLTYSSSAGEWDKKLITERLAKALPAPNAATTRVVIAADQRVAYGIVVAVIDAVKDRGYNAIALESAPP